MIETEVRRDQLEDSPFQRCGFYVRDVRTKFDINLERGIPFGFEFCSDDQSFRANERQRDHPISFPRTETSTNEKEFSLGMDRNEARVFLLLWKKLSLVVHRAIQSQTRDVTRSLAN